MTTEDHDRVAQLLGRPPQGRFEVVVRDADGSPVVIRNAPLLLDGTPMPTRYWLVGATIRLLVDRLEAAGGVRAAEAEVDADALASAHHRYAAERDTNLPAGWSGARPSGGVGGTRRGVKCLHAHYAWYLAGGEDPVGAWVHGRLGSGQDRSSMSDPSPRTGPVPVGAVAAIDCGTNSTRLLISDADGASRARLMRVTRLGQGVDRTHVLAPSAIERTMAVLREYRQVMDDHDVQRVRMTATSAARDATNREALFDAAERTVGVRPELLGGAEEGRLSFVGATAELDLADGPWLVADIGGGSTELAVGPSATAGSDRLAPLAVRSLDIGCVRITERFLVSDPPAHTEMRAASHHVQELLVALSSEESAFAEADTMVGLAGTVAALASLDQQLTGYDRSHVHHHVLTRDAVDALLEGLAGQSVAARLERGGMEAERADVIVGGAIVVSSLLHHFGLDRCLTSEADILDGLTMSLLAGA